MWRNNAPAHLGFAYRTSELHSMRDTVLKFGVTARILLLAE